MACRDHAAMPLATAPRDASPHGQLGRRARSLLRTRTGTRTERAAPNPAPELTGRRRPLVVAGGAFIVVICAALGAVVAGRVGHRVSFLVASRRIPVGVTITASDLATIQISPAPGLDAIPASRAAEVVGHRSANPVDPGALVVPGDLATGSGLANGEALVGAALADNQLPSGLGSGQVVLVVLSGTSGTSGSPGTGAGAASGTVPASSAPQVRSGAGRSGVHPAPSPTAPPGTVLATATVTGVEGTPSSSATSATGPTSVIVTLEVPEPAAPAVTAASAAGDVSLAVVGTGRARR